MKVALGSIEVSDHEALALGTVGKRGGRKPAGRAQVKDWVLAQARLAIDIAVKRMEHESGDGEPEPEGD